jgi:peptidoglycan/xylan/chitin deacetylase (PgdA/CDA1 family)
MSTSRRAFLAAVTAGAAAAASSACSVETDEPQATATSGVSSGSSGRTSSALSTGEPPPTSGTAGPATTTAQPDLVHGPRDRPNVALTFHGAGDPRLARRVLEMALTANAGLTVLAVGTWLDQTPALARQILEAGHDLGNHTWSHLPMRRLGRPAADREVSRAALLIERLTGSRGSWFRPSGTPRSTATIRGAALASGYPRCLAYDVDPLDYTDPGSAVVTRRLLDQVRPGSIVSLHLGHAGTVNALPGIFRGLTQRGLRPVTVTDLMRGAARS